MHSPREMTAYGLRRPKSARAPRKRTIQWLAGNMPKSTITSGYMSISQM